MLSRSSSLRSRRGVTLVELMVALIIGGLLWTLGANAGVQAGASRSPEEVCRLNRLRLNQTLAVHGPDGGRGTQVLSEAYVRGELLAKGLLQTMPQCRSGEDVAWPYSMSRDGTVTCRHHGEGQGPRVATVDNGVMAGIVSALGWGLGFGLQCGLLLLLLVGLSRLDVAVNDAPTGGTDLARINRSVRHWLTRFGEQQRQRESDERIERARRGTTTVQSGSELVDEMAVLVAAIEPSTSGRCPVCATDAPRNEAACPQCDAPHHVECYSYNRGCGIYGCVGSP